MRVLKSFVLSISMYSKIPMPQINCDEEDTKYTMIFFPLVGVVIGALVILWSMLCGHFEVPEIARVLITIAIPLIITGGFHLDGYMDTSDARSSYQPKERKLEILKDSHIGAFAVIRVLVYMLIYIAAVATISDMKYIWILALSFVMTRIFSGLSVLTFKNARKEGMLFYTARTAQRVANIVVLVIELVIVVAAMLYIAWMPALVAIGMVLLSFLYYRLMSYHTFGGITGDLAGWFVTFAECAVAVGLGIAGFCLPM